MWDEGIILRQQLGYSEYTARLAGRMEPAEVLAWWDPRPETWIAESAELRERVYPQTSAEWGLGTEESPVILRYRYNYDWTPTIEHRLQQSGVRIAAFLDWVFAPEG